MAHEFAATLVELVNGGPPCREYFQTPVQIAFAVADGKLRPELKAAASRACPGIAAVAQECVARDPTSRPSFAKIVDAFDAILPPGQSCILAVGGSKPTVVPVDGMIGVKTMMTVNLTADHRHINGDVAATFLKTLKAVIEDPKDLVY